MTRPEQSQAARKEARGRHLWTTFGLTVEQWDRQYMHQEGQCMYCRQRGDDLAGRHPMVPDHEHDSPFRFRGLGHSRCNRIAGLVEAALADPPAYGAVDHRVSADRVAAMVRHAELAKARKRTPHPEPKPPGDRQTYHYGSGMTRMALNRLEQTTEQGGT